MAVRFLSGIAPAPPGFEPSSLEKRDLLSGFVVALAARFEDVIPPGSGLEERVHGCVVTISEPAAVARVGPALWHFAIPASTVGPATRYLESFATVLEETAEIQLRARETEIELDRVRHDLVSTRHDYNETTLRLTEKVRQAVALHERVRESEERFRALVEASSDWVWAVDDSGRYTYSSPKVRDLLGYAPEEVLGRPAFELLTPEETTRVRALFESLARDRKPLVALENVALRRDGSRVVLETSGVPIVDGEGRLRGYHGIDRDITERKRAEDDRLRLERRVHEAQKLESLGVMAGGIAHDFNNILTAVIGHAELALEHVPSSSPAHSSLVEIGKAARRAADLSRQMLAYSGRGAFVVEDLDLNALLADMLPLVRAAIHKKSELDLRLGEGLPAIRADATQVRQVVLNLIVNASEALGEREGRITVSTGYAARTREELAASCVDDGLPAGEYVVLEVVDTGCGIDPETRHRIFEPFFSTKFTGRGLGLATVLGIVRGHRGALELRSSPDQGTSFRVLLPPSPVCAAFRDEPEAAPVAPVASGTVLLVDDEEPVRIVGAAMLARLGFQTISAADGLEALEICRASGSELRFVILDLTMPHMDGAETFREIRRLREDLPVFLSSGYGEADLVSRFADAGFAGFIQKPYRLQTLSRALCGEPAPAPDASETY